MLNRFKDIDPGKYSLKPGSKSKNQFLCDRHRWLFESETN